MSEHTTKVLGPAGDEPGGDDELTSDTLLMRLDSHRRAASPFEERGELGSGGMGRVLKAFDKDLRRTVAVKMLKQLRGDVAEEMRQRFLQEAQVTAQLDHPGVPPIHELGVSPEGEVFYVMPRLRGRTLEVVFQECWKGNSSWSLERCVGILQRICETLAFAHSRGVLHRDIKPANIMVGDYGEVLVIDWGLARLIREEEGDDQVWTDRIETLLRESAELMITSPKGTPGYMAPEQVSYEASLQDERVDIYAVGAVLYLLISQMVPHSDSLAALARKGFQVEDFRELLGHRPKPLHELAPRAPAELVAICEKAMAPSRRARYQDMDELAEDLRAYLEVRPVEAYRTGAWVEFTKWVRRNQMVAGLTSALLVGGLGASVYGFTLERDRAEALQAKQDQERNMTGGVLMDSVLARSPGLFAAPSQLEVAQSVLRDGDTLMKQVDDLPQRLMALKAASSVDMAGTADEDRDPVLIDELERQMERLPEVEAALARAAAIEARIESESRHRPSVAEVQAGWERAITALAADSRFAGHDIEVRSDLLPLGPTQPAGLWAFLALETADFSTPLDADDPDAVGPDRGLILLLIPGGDVKVGALQPADEAGVSLPHRDVWAKPDEGDLTTVTLEPYFLGRHEVTRAQWARVMNMERGDCPVPDGASPGRMPVEMVSRAEAREFARRLGLDIPSEAQWEAAARARTEGPAFFDLPYVTVNEGGPNYDWRGGARYANVLDRRGFDLGLEGGGRADFPSEYAFGEPDDGFAQAAPVGSYQPNPFGLFDMCGNVWEWCRDEYSPRWGDLAITGDGQRTRVTELYGAVIRGGSWYVPMARVADRYELQPVVRAWDTGFRVGARATAP